MRAGKLAIVYGGVSASLVALAALYLGASAVSWGVVLGWAATGFSLLTIMVLTKALTALHQPQKGRNLAWLWALVKLPVLAASTVVVVALGQTAVWSFLWTVCSVYSLLLCVAWMESRAQSDPEPQSEDDTEPD